MAMTTTEINDVFLRKLNDIIRKLDDVLSLKCDIENFKMVFLKQSTIREAAVHRLAGNFEHLLNSQKELQSRMANVENRGRIVEEKIDQLIGKGADRENKILHQDQFQRDIAVSEQPEEPLADHVSNYVEEKAKSEMNDGYAVKDNVVENIHTGENEELYKCFNLNCQAVLPKLLSPKKDGVSVSCKNIECGTVNLAGNLKEDHKWISIECNGKRHHQQVLKSKEAQEMMNCLVCGNDGVIIDANYGALSLISKASSEPNPLETKDKITRKDVIYKCWNSNCNRIFPKNIQRRPDKVSVQCPDNACKQINIIAKLHEGYKWMGMNCIWQRRQNIWHFQQFPIGQMHKGKGQCNVCGTERTTFGACTRIAIPS